MSQPKNPNDPKKPLGRGLDSLFGTNPNIPKMQKKEGLARVPLNALIPGKYQPRSEFKEKDLTELANSIRENGVIQPILVRPTGGKDKFDNLQYEIIAGERRWRASIEAGKQTIPVVIKHLNNKEALECGLIENIQRHDLNPLEEATGYKRLVNDFHYTQEALAKTLGKSRSHVANILRLLSLPKMTQDFLRDNSISASHARALVGCEKADEFALMIVKQGLNVRQTERMIAEYNKDPHDHDPSSNTRDNEPSPHKTGVYKPFYKNGEPDIKSIEILMSQELLMKVKVNVKADQSGSITMKFKSPTSLDKLLSYIFRPL